jgi:type IV secretion system protein TrbJ
MKSFLRKTATLVVAIAALLPQISSAQLMTFDPINYVMNYITAYKNISDEVMQLKQLEQMVKANRSMLSGNSLNDMNTQLARVQAMRFESERLQNAVGRSGDAFKNIETMYGASAAPNWTTFSDDMARKIRMQDKVATNTMTAAETADKQLQASLESHQRVANALGGAAGATEATQATGAAVGLVVQNSQAMLGLMSAQAKQQAFDAAKGDAKQQNGEAAIAAARERDKADLERFKARFPAPAH